MRKYITEMGEWASEWASEWVDCFFFFFENVIADRHPHFSGLESNPGLSQPYQRIVRNIYWLSTSVKQDSIQLIHERIETEI